MSDSTKHSFASEVSRLIDVLAEADTTLPEQLENAYDNGGLDKLYGIDDVVNWQRDLDPLLITAPFEEVIALLTALDDIAKRHTMPDNRFENIRAAYVLEYRELDSSENQFMGGESDNVSIDGTSEPLSKKR